MGLNIKRAIKSRHLEVKEVAIKMGISPVGLSQHINGNPSVEVLERIASAIGCDISELFDSPCNPISGTLTIDGKEYNIILKRK